MSSESTEMDRERRFADLDERQLIEAAKVDSRALSILYRNHYAGIFGYVQRRIGNDHDTNDIVSEVFMSMVRSLPRFSWTGAPFQCWLLRLATTQINRWVRKRNVFRFWQSLEERQVAFHKPNDRIDERLEMVRQSMLALPCRFQTVLALHYFEELSVEAIAGVLDCRPGTVKSRLSRGRELLRKKLERLKTMENHDEQRTIGILPEKVEV